MKDNFIHICFVIDESGSMGSSIDDVVNGFNDMIKEQQQVTDGQCAVSLYKFADNVVEVYRGKDVHDVNLMEGLNPYSRRSSLWNFNSFVNKITTSVSSLQIDQDNKTVTRDAATTYCPDGCTAMNDGIGTAIDKIGLWLSGMDESERPSKNLIVVMTDGGENASTEYKLEKVKEMIKHQTDVYSWEFMYIGTDITSTADANAYGFKYKAYNTRSDVKSSWDTISAVTTNCRCATMDSCYDIAADLEASTKTLNAKYLKKTGLDMN